MSSIWSVKYIYFLIAGLAFQSSLVSSSGSGCKILQYEYYPKHTYEYHCSWSRNFLFLDHTLAIWIVYHMWGKRENWVGGIQLISYFHSNFVWSSKFYIPNHILPNHANWKNPTINVFQPYQSECLDNYSFYFMFIGAKNCCVEVEKKGDM